MAPAATWTPDADKDLMFAIIGLKDGTEKLPVKWTEVETTMKSWGYDMSKNAMEQRWNKSILKSFKARRGGASGSGAAGNDATPSATPTPKKTPRKRVAKPANAASDDDDDFNVTPKRARNTLKGDNTPRMTAKTAKQGGAKVKKEDDDAGGLPDDGFIA